MQRDSAIAHGNAGAGQHFHDVPEVRHRHGLAAAERNVGDARLDDLAGERQRLIAGKLVPPCMAVAGLLATGEAGGIAPVRQLPGEEERCPVFVKRPPIHAGKLRSGEADIGLRHHLLRNVFELRGLP